MHLRKSNPLFHRLPFALAMLCFMLIAVSGHDGSRLAAAERLTVPIPQLAQNGAIHYQRAILFLMAVDPALREVLEKPIWEIVTPETSPKELTELNQLLIESRHAIRSALTGADQTEADFGLDLRHYMLSSLVPHNQSMVRLARLTAIHGMQREMSGNWHEAAEIYFAVMRTGRHMTHQATLAEAVSGVEILETAYYSLGHWAAHCPDAALVDEASDLLSTLFHDLTEPAQTMQTEVTIVQLRLDAMRDAFPDGAWAEMVLETLDISPPADNPQGLRDAAIEAATSRGVPQEAFDSKESFHRYITELSSTYVDLASESALCLARPSPESIRCGEAVFNRFKPRLLKTKNTSARDPGKIAALFAVHQAELTMTRLILAVSASRTSSGFPADLTGVAEKLGGQIPKSPYDGSELIYKPLEEGKGFSVLVPEVTIGEIVLPKINFRHLPVSTKE